MSRFPSTAPAIACALFLCTAVWAADERAGTVRARYDKPKNKAFLPIMKDLKANRLLEDMADSINETIHLPADLTLLATECGESNAFYDPQEQTVSLCYEMIADDEALFRADAGEEGEPDEEAVALAVHGDVLFTMYHEIGHALIDLLELPITGREEDAADQLATVVLVESDDDAGIDAALDGAYTFILYEQENEEEGGDQALWDEHSLNLQRYYNITCWVYGSDPEAFAEIVEDAELPEGRAERCPEEWEQTSNAWATLLDPHTKETADADASEDEDDSEGE